MYYTAIFITVKMTIFSSFFFIFLIFTLKHRLWVLVRTACQGSSNVYPQSMFWSKNKKNLCTPVNPTSKIQN